MRVIVQRVSNAKVVVKDVVISQIEKGLLVLLGIKKGDTLVDVNFLCEKICNLRIFADCNDKLNLSISDVGGQVLLVSNFTIYGNAQKGRRPSFDESETFALSEPLFNAFYDRLVSLGITTQKGEFGADMQVGLVNDGPVTLIINSMNN